MRLRIGFFALLASLLVPFGSAWKTEGQPRIRSAGPPRRSLDRSARVTTDESLVVRGRTRARVTRHRYGNAGAEGRLRDLPDGAVLVGVVSLDTRLGHFAQSARDGDPAGVPEHLVVRQQAAHAGLARELMPTRFFGRDRNLAGVTLAVRTTGSKPTAEVISWRSRSVNQARDERASVLVESHRREEAMGVISSSLGGIAVTDVATN